MTNKEKLGLALPLADEIDSLYSRIQLKHKESRELYKKIDELKDNITTILELEKNENTEMDIRSSINRLAAEEYFRMMKEGIGND